MPEDPAVGHPTHPLTQAPIGTASPLSSLLIRASYQPLAQRSKDARITVPPHRQSLRHGHQQLRHQPLSTLVQSPHGVSLDSPVLLRGLVF